MIGLFIYEQTWRFFIDLVGKFPHPPLERFARRQNRKAGFLSSLIRGDVVGGPIDLLPVATIAVGAFGGIALVSVFVAGRDPDE